MVAVVKTNIVKNKIPLSNKIGFHVLDAHQHLCDEFLFFLVIVGFLPTNSMRDSSFLDSRVHRSLSQVSLSNEKQKAFLSKKQEIPNDTYCGVEITRFIYVISIILQEYASRNDKVIFYFLISSLVERNGTRVC